MSTATTTTVADVQEKFNTLSLKGAPQPLQNAHTLDKFEKFDLTPVIGTEFKESDDVQLSKFVDAANSDELIKDLAILVSQRGVVFFRNQDIPIDKQRILGAKLGELSQKPSSSKLAVWPLQKEDAELGDHVTIISNENRGPYDDALDKTRLASKYWHADISFEVVPSDYAILKIIELPHAGGDTIWASGYEVYDRLSPSFAAYLETLSAYHHAHWMHDIAKAIGTRIRVEERGSPANSGDTLEAIHPVVRTNPVTGWKSVYVNPGFTKRIVGVTKDESDIILNYLYSLFVENHDLQVRFKWTKNAIAIWDNRSHYHTATYDIPGQKRTGNRVVSLGERPYYDANSQSRRKSLGIKPWM